MLASYLCRSVHLIAGKKWPVCATDSSGQFVGLRLILASFAFVAALGSVPGVGQAAPRAGVAAAVVGDVGVTPMNTARKAATTGMDVFLGDRVDSEERSRMQVLLLDETVFTIGPKSDLVIDKFVYDPEANTGELTASFTKGLFRYVSGKLAKANPESIRIRVPNAIIGIRGTTMFGITDALTGGLFYGLLGPGKDNNGGLADGGFTYQPDNAKADDDSATRNVVRAGFGVLVKDDVAGPVMRTPERLINQLQNQLTGGPGPLATARLGGQDDGSTNATENSGQLVAETGQSARSSNAALAVNGVARDIVENATENGDSNEAVSSRTAALLSAAQNSGFGQLPVSVDIPYAVELSWSNIPDLDLHLTGPNASGVGRFHVFWDNIGSYNIAPFAALDNDRTGIGGSEVIGINKLSTGSDYRASAFNFEDDTIGSTSLSTMAELTMRLIKGGRISRGPSGSTIVTGTVLATVSPAAGPAGNTYTGFTFNSAGTPTVVNAFSDSTDSAAVP